MRLNLPNIRRIARSGTVFKEAFVPSPLCAPSRACLAAGRNYDSSGVRIIFKRLSDKSNHVLFEIKRYRILDHDGRKR